MSKQKNGKGKVARNKTKGVGTISYTLNKKEVRALEIVAGVLNADGGYGDDNTAQTVFDAFVKCSMCEMLNDPRLLAEYVADGIETGFGEDDEACKDLRLKLRKELFAAFEIAS